MNNETILFLIVFLPLAGSAVLPMLGRVSIKLRNFAAFCMVLSSFLLSLVILPAILRGQTVAIAINLPLGFNFIFKADGLALFMAMVSSFISAIIVLYSFSYISHYENQNEYYTMVVLFLGSMMGLTFSANLILLYVFWEMTAITSWRLIGFFREKTYVLRADKAFLMTFFGALVMLIGFINIYQATGTFDLKPAAISDLAVLLILAGILSKSATLPLHTWLPDAGVAPSPVTALLHAAILVKIGVYVFARLFIATFTTTQFWHTAVPVLAGASALVCAGAALIETDLKRLIAYSTISQIGFIFLGFACGGSLGIAGSLLYILMHGLSKAGLFLCAGIIEQNAKTKDINQMGGFLYTMPVTAIAFLACAFSVMGFPPFGGFFSKYMVIAGTLETGHLVIAGVFLFGATLTILYLFRAFNLIFLGEPKNSSVKEGTPLMLSCVALFAGLSLAAGIFISWPGQLAQTVVQGLSGVR